MFTYLTMEGVCHIVICVSNTRLRLTSFGLPARLQGRGQHKPKRSLGLVWLISTVNLPLRVFGEAGLEQFLTASSLETESVLNFATSFSSIYSTLPP
jgi:hypothetical protein